MILKFLQSLIDGLLNGASESEDAGEGPIVSGELLNHQTGEFDDWPKIDGIYELDRFGHEVFEDD